MSNGIDRVVRKIEPAQDAQPTTSPEKFRDYLQTPNLILLGDPGSGKTFTFETAAKKINSKYITVRSFLTKRIENIQHKTLFLDGLDEFRARSDNKNLLLDVIKKLEEAGCPNLRLSCRSIDWLGDTDLSIFKDYFAGRSYAVLNLEPLTEEEINDILKQRNITVDSFIKSATAYNLGSLLTNPQTLIMLANVVGRGDWPATKTELYEKATELLLSEHSNPQSQSDLGQYHAKELVESAGAICASILLSDSAGISINNNLSSPFFPSFRTLPFYETKKTQACLTRRLFPTTETGSDFVNCIHRTVAEFLGAKWLKTQMERGLPLGRVQSLIGIDGHPSSELRGLHAWLATQCSEHAAALIPKDPYGILVYGDPAFMPPKHRHTLLSSLEALSASDPWFRAGDWSRKPLGALSKPDMIEEFSRILLSPDSNFHLKGVVLEAIINGPPLSEMRQTLLQLLENDAACYSERADAIKALLYVSPAAANDLEKVYREKLANQPERYRLRAKILSEIYSHGFTPEDVRQVFKDTLDKANDISVGELWFLARELPVNDLPDIVNELHYLLVEETQGKRTREGYNVESAFSTLLDRLLESGEVPSPGKLYSWLKALYYFRRYGYGSTGNDKTKARLKENKPLVFKMFVNEYNKLTSDDDVGKLRRDFSRITMYALSTIELAQHILSFIKGLNHLHEKDIALFGQSLVSLFSESPESLDLYLGYYAFAKTNPDLLEVHDLNVLEVIPKWRLEDHTALKKFKLKERNRKRKNVKNLVITRESVRSGENLHNLGWLAEHFFGHYRNSDKNEKPIERLRNEIGDELTLDAIQGFKAVLHRDDLPAPSSIAGNSRYTWWYAILAGMDIQEKTGVDLCEFSDQELKSMYALSLEMHTFEQEGNTSYLTPRDWPNKIKEKRPDLAESVEKEIIETKCAQGEKYISFLTNLPENTAFEPWQPPFALQLLRRYPKMEHHSLLEMISCASHASECHKELLLLTKDVLGNRGLVQKDRRAIWLTTGLVLDIKHFKTPFSNYAKQRNWVIWKTRDLINKIRQTEIQLNQHHYECIISIFGKQHESVSHPTGGWSGDKSPWNATEFIQSCIDALSALVNREATSAMESLLNDKKLSSYHDYIKHALAKQRTVRRDAEFEQPTWQQTIAVLSGGKPANISDLHALIFDHLEELTYEIKHSNTDKYKAFWKTGDHGKLISPAIEDDCRDRLIDLLQPKISPAELHAEPEGHMAADKRSDIIIYGTDKKLPIELKRDYHKDLWTACMNQLERLYTRDPQASGYGIYGVFWFGDKRSKNMPKPPTGVTQPATPLDLEDTLNGLIPEKHRGRIRAIVVDVTPPA